MISIYSPNKEAIDLTMYVELQAPAPRLRSLTITANWPHAPERHLRCASRRGHVHHFDIDFSAYHPSYHAYYAGDGVFLMALMTAGYVDPVEQQ
jgi:hypothetical protein